MSETDPPTDTTRAARTRSRRNGLGNRTLLGAGVVMGVTAVIFAFAAATHTGTVTRTVGTDTTTEIEHVAAAAATEAVTGASTASSASTIAISNDAFSPASLTIPAGTTVTWTNDDSVDHTVTTTSAPVSFDSGQLAHGQTFSHAFTTAGTYKYYCADHPNMTATIVVTSATTTPPTTTATATSSAPGTTTGTTTTTSAPATTTSGTTMTMTGTASTGCASVGSSLTMLINHIETVHLEEPITQQIADILNLNQYVLAHETLVANMLVPVLEAASNGTSASLNMFLEHVKTVHLEEPITQQIADILNLDQYVLAHETLIVNMLQPYVSILTGNC
jgi:plastocyanin